MRLLLIALMLLFAAPVYAGDGSFEDRCGIGWDMLPGQTNPFPGGVVLSLSPKPAVMVRVVYGATPYSMTEVVGAQTALSASQVLHYKLEPTGGLWGYYSVECSFDAGTTWTKYGTHRLKPGKPTGTALDMKVVGWGDDHSVNAWLGANCGDGSDPDYDSFSGVKAGIMREDADAFIVTGDMAMVHSTKAGIGGCLYNGVTSTAKSAASVAEVTMRWQLVWNETFHPILADTPLLIVMGNHDECNAWADNEGGAQNYPNGCITDWPTGKYAAIAQPSLSYGLEADTGGQYFAARFGNAKFLIYNWYLDTATRPRSSTTCESTFLDRNCGSADWTVSAQQQSDMNTWATSTTEPYVIAASHALCGGVTSDQFSWHYSRFGYAATGEWVASDGKAGTEQGKFQDCHGSLEADLMSRGVTGWILGHDHITQCGNRYNQAGPTTFFYCAFTQPTAWRETVWIKDWSRHRQWTDWIGDGTFEVEKPFGTGGRFVADDRGFVVMELPAVGNGNFVHVMTNRHDASKNLIRTNMFPIVQIP